MLSWIPDVGRQPGVVGWCLEGKPHPWQSCSSQRLLCLMAWHLHIELSFFCLQQLFLSVLEAYIRGWALLWHPEQIGSLSGDGRARAACPSSLSSQARRPVAVSAPMASARPAAAWAIQLEVCFAVTSVLPFPEAVCLGVEDLHSGVQVVFGTCCCCCHLWFPVTISKVWCPPQHYLHGPALLGLVTTGLMTWLL